jgi:SAM-dependent methyltransferase
VIAPLDAPPSAWLRRWAELIPAGGRVLDLACGAGRHARYLAGLGLRVDAVDIDLGAAAPLFGTPGIAWLARDLERGGGHIEAGAYQGIVVVNYLHRPLFPKLLAGLAAGGVLIYETFAHGQQAYGRPRNPAHLLMPGELLELARGALRVVAYEDIHERQPVAARVQRLCAVKP